MPNLTWRDAITQVLKDSSEAMHYTEIAEAIAKQELRTEFGATPAATVRSLISTSLGDEKDQSPFFRVEPGRYQLRAPIGKPAAQAPSPDEAKTVTGLINAFGMYWSRLKVLWNPSPPRLLGQQQLNSTPVDFCSQRGVYLLHDGRAVVYVGRTTDQPLGLRLRQHTVDRLNSRWDRFSWFGVFPVLSTGALETIADGSYDLSTLIVTMEALLIEGLEPPQNRKRGDDFKAVEFLQIEDREIQRAQAIRVLDELKKNLTTEIV